MAAFRTILQLSGLGSPEQLKFRKFGASVWENRLKFVPQARFCDVRIEKTEKNGVLTIAKLFADGADRTAVWRLMMLFI